MADLASFWIGDRLGPIEVASLQSFLRFGDHMTLYCVGNVAGVPKGVECRPASEIMPCDNILRHRKTGSPALHSDLFRYQLLARTDKIWVDLDVIALKPFDFPTPWVFGYESPLEINGAVLRLPRESAALQALLALTPETRGLPEYLSGFRRWKYWLKGMGRGLPIDRWPWGALGPRALTYYLRKTGEIAHALPVSAFYSVPLTETRRFLDPGGLTPDELPSDAWAVHLWAKELRGALATHHGGQVPRGSFLDRLLAGAS